MNEERLIQLLLVVFIAALKAVDHQAKSKKRARKAEKSKADARG